MLVVGHSNTVNDLLDQLGVSGQPELAENTFDRLFIVHRTSATQNHFEPLHYGVPSN